LIECWNTYTPLSDSLRFEIRIQTSTVLNTQVVLTVQESDITPASFTVNLGRRSQMFSLFPAARLPNVTFVPQTDSGFELMLRAAAGERFQVSAGTYRLILAMTMAEVGATAERLVSTAANGYVRIELIDLVSPAPLDADWFTADATTGLGQDTNGKWVVKIRGSSKPLASAMSFAAMRISFVYVMAQSGRVVSRRSAHSVTVVASASAAVSVTYALG
jgi:hypothetical protein